MIAAIYGKTTLIVSIPLIGILATGQRRGGRRAKGYAGKVRAR